MKDQFETKIKSVVEEFSYDYDPKAWEALSKKLPQANSGFSWLGKIAIASIVAVIIGALGWSLFSTKETKTTAKQASQPKSIQKTQPTSTKAVQKSTTTAQPNPKQNTSTIAPNNEANIDWTQITQEVVAGTDWHLAPIAFRQQQTTMPITSETFKNDGGQMPQVQEHLLPLDLLGQQAQKTIPTPCKGPKIVLDADAINYEDGTPRIRINAESSVAEISWSANGTLLNKKNRSVDLLAFQGQTYTITAQAQLDGCSSTEKINITAYEDYNLLAVNAFNPQSRDERNATFMPYALTIRDVRFELIVIDPDNGGIVFRTKDAQNAWDGTDQRNGQMVPAQKAYIWKVVLQDVLPSEKTTYSGTIVRI